MRLWLQKTTRRADNRMINIDKPKRPKSELHPVSIEGVLRILTIRMRTKTRARILLASL